MNTPYIIPARSSVQIVVNGVSHECKPMRLVEHTKGMGRTSITFSPLAKAESQLRQMRELFQRLPTEASLETLMEALRAKPVSEKERNKEQPC